MKSHSASWALSPILLWLSLCSSTDPDFFEVVLVPTHTSKAIFAATQGTQPSTTTENRQQDRHNELGIFQTPKPNVQIQEIPHSYNPYSQQEYVFPDSNQTHKDPISARFIFLNPGPDPLAQYNSTKERYVFQTPVPNSDEDPGTNSQDQEQDDFDSEESYDANDINEDDGQFSNYSFIYMFRRDNSTNGSSAINDTNPNNYQRQSYSLNYTTMFLILIPLLTSLCLVCVGYCIHQKIW